jgi:dihydrofolate reductase
MSWTENNENLEVIPDLQQFLDKYKNDLVWVLWWWKIFDALMPYIDELYLTIIENKVNWDTFFPQDFKKHFKSMESTPWLDPGTHYETYKK